MLSVNVHYKHLGLQRHDVYRVYQKKLNRFEIALNFAKHLLVSGFIYI